MIVACRNEMCDHESDGENKEQETTHDKHLSDDVSKPRAGQFSNNLHSYVNNIIKVILLLPYSYYYSMNSKARFQMLCRVTLLCRMHLGQYQASS